MNGGKFCGLLRAVVLGMLLTFLSSLTIVRCAADPVNCDTVPWSLDAIRCNENLCSTALANSDLNLMLACWCVSTNTYTPGGA